MPEPIVWNPMSQNRSHRLGYEAEHAVETILNVSGFPVYRPRAGAAQDKGDLIGAGVVISVKNHARTSLSEWIGALPRMCEAASLPCGVVWHKRRGKGSPGDWYVTMDGDTFLVFLTAYNAVSS
jgi:hypothetical protein